MRNERNVAFYLSDPRDDCVDTMPDIVWAFSVRTSIGKKKPARRLRSYLFGRKPLIVAVIPLEEISIDFGVSKSRQCGGFAGSPERAYQNSSERYLGQYRSQLLG